jgi:hypothetical protein
MKLQKLLFMVSVICLFIPSATIVSAGDFDWLKDLNIQAQVDPSGFKIRLATRFNIGDTQINAVLSNVPEPADAYMVLRLAEMSSKPTDYVIEQYKSDKNKGWGVLAKSLGIKPGSQEFEALKRGHDLHNDNAKDVDQSKGNKQDKGKEKN